MRFLQQCWKRCYTDKRAFMFGTLTRGELWINRAAFFGRLEALAVLLGAGGLACWLVVSEPLLAVLLALLALSAISIWLHSKAFAADAQLLKISLRNRMREGQPVCDPSSLPGNTALQKRYWFLKGDNPRPVATFRSMYRTLRESGLPPWTAFTTTVLSLLSFGPKTQRGMTWAQKRSAGIGLLRASPSICPTLARRRGSPARAFMLRRTIRRDCRPANWTCKNSSACSARMPRAAIT